MAEKTGSGLFVRRSVKNWSILAWHAKQTTLCKLTSDILSYLLTEHNLTVRKNSSKSVKIRALLLCDDVKTNCTEQEIQSMENAVAKMEEARNKKSQREAEEADEEDEDCEHDDAEAMSNETKVSRMPKP